MAGSKPGTYRWGRWIRVPGLQDELFRLAGLGNMSCSEMAQALQLKYGRAINRAGFDPMTTNMVIGKLNKPVIMARRRKAREEGNRYARRRTALQAASSN